MLKSNLPDYLNLLNESDKTESIYNLTEMWDALMLQERIPKERLESIYSTYVMLKDILYSMHIKSVEQVKMN
jgi:hypothetical protein